MRVFLHDGPAHLQIVSRSGIRDFRDVGAAVEFLRPLLAQPHNVTAIREAIGGTLRTDQQLIEELALRMVSEGLQVVSCADRFFAAIQGTATIEGSSQSAQTTPLEDEQAAAEEKKAATTPQEKHWIELELVYDSGAPVTDELYLVELPRARRRRRSRHRESVLPRSRQIRVHAEVSAHARTHRQTG
jgi:hypothetical protein